MTAVNNLTHSKFWKRTPFLGFLIAAISLNLLTILVFLLVKNFLPPVVPLFYGRPGGEGQLVPAFGLLIAPILSIVFILINSLISNITQDLFTRKLLIVSAFLVSLLTTITFFKIIFLVGFF